MKNLRLKYALVCDDVRREDNGKELLIGVYSTDMRVASFPANLPLVFWVRGYNEKAGDFPFEFRVTGPGGVELSRGDGRLTIPIGNQPLSFWLGPIPIQIQSEGELRLEVREPAGEWKELELLMVRRRETPHRPPE